MSFPRMMDDKVFVDCALGSVLDHSLTALTLPTVGLDRWLVGYGIVHGAWQAMLPVFSLQCHPRLINKSIDAAAIS